MQEIGDRTGYARVMSVSGMVYADQGDLEKAKGRLEEGLAMASELGDRWNLSVARSYLGEVARLRGQYDEAESWFNQVIAERREWGEPKITAWSLMLLARIEIVRGNYAQAARHLSESFSLDREAGNRVTLPSLLESWAFLFAASKNPRRAARLLGTAQALREKLGTSQRPIWRTECEHYLAGARSQLDEASFRAAWDEGHATPLEQAMAEVEQETIAAPAGPAPALPRDPNALTARELDVLRLVAAGLSDAQIAARLVISRRTVSTHLTAIYGKLCVNSRSAAARCALDRKLI
jgi:ATP/maltotriose-dependent transcriptional regulator MalT